MSRFVSPRRLLRIAVAPFSLCCALALAPSASAVSAQMEYDCVLPGGTVNRVSVTWILALPTSANVGTPIPSTKVSMPINFQASLWDLADANDVASIEVAAATSKLDVSLPSAQLTWAISSSGDVIRTTGPRSRLAFNSMEGKVAPTTFSEAGSVTFTASTITLNLRFRDAAGRAVAIPATQPDSDGDPGTVDVSCALAPSSDSFVATLPVFQFNDVTPPTRPGKPIILSAPAPTTARLQWGAASDDGSGVARYVVLWDGSWSESPTTTGWAGPMMPDREHAVRIVAYDRAGNGSEPSEPVIVRTTTSTLPLSPTNVRFTPTGAGTATVSWDRPADARITGYEVQIWDGLGTARDGFARIGGSPNSATFTGLPARARRLIRVEAENSIGARSFRVDIDWLAPQTYSVDATADFQRLTSRPARLAGQLSLQSEPGGALRPTLALAANRVKLMAAGTIPLTADLTLVPSAAEQQATYSDSGVLVVAARVKVRVPRVYLFGAIPVGLAGTCQTRTYSDLSLTSNVGFTLLDGGVMRGSLAISDLSGCGALNGLVSPQTASEGNPVELRVAPIG